MWRVCPEKAKVQARKPQHAIKLSAGLAEEVGGRRSSRCHSRLITRLLTQRPHRPSPVGFLEASPLEIHDRPRVLLLEDRVSAVELSCCTATEGLAKLWCKPAFHLKTQAKAKSEQRICPPSPPPLCKKNQARCLPNCAQPQEAAGQGGNERNG